MGVVVVFWPYVEFHSSKLSDSKLCVNHNSRGIIYLKEVYVYCNPKVTRNLLKWSYVQILFCKLE